MSAGSMPEWSGNLKKQNKTEQRAPNFSLRSQRGRNGEFKERTSSVGGGGPNSEVQLPKPLTRATSFQPGGMTEQDPQKDTSLVAIRELGVMQGAIMRRNKKREICSRKSKIKLIPINIYSYSSFSAMQIGKVYVCIYVLARD